VAVVETTCTGKKTAGKYRVIKIYGAEERKAVTKYWQESLENKKETKKF